MNIKLKHTQGKWEINLYGQSQNSKAIHIGPLGYVDGIAAVLFYEGKEEEQLANAKLIAAAPLMLDELRKQEDTLNMLILATPTGELRDQLTAMNIERMDVIRKATGRK